MPRNRLNSQGRVYVVHAYLRARCDRSIFRNFVCRNPTLCTIPPFTDALFRAKSYPQLKIGPENGPAEAELGIPAMIRTWFTALVAFGMFCMSLAFAAPSHAAPYAAMVIDARTGEVLHARNADTRLHPASLTKMMTLYIAFEAIRLGEISLDTRVRVSQNAANEPPSKLGLRSGQRIALRYLIRASAVKSANDAATAIGEAISGSEAAFTRRMNRTAVALGMTRTNFRNAHGLTQSGHLSTARDMTTMGRRLHYDYPQYYNLFSRLATDTSMGQVRNTNRRVLNAYRGADGIKTGYTRAAGWNLVASARRGDVRIIATVFGGRSGATRNARVIELLDMGFARAPRNAPTRAPDLPNYREPRGPLAVSRSLRPMPRPDRTDPAEMIAIAEGVASALADVQPEATEIAPTPAPRPAPRDMAQADPEPGAPVPNTLDLDVAVSTSTDPTQTLEEAEPAEVNGPRFVAVTPLEPPAPRIITRDTSPAEGTWRVIVGAYNTQREAEHKLLQVAIREMAMLSVAERKIERRSGQFEAAFSGLSQSRAEMTCRRLRAQAIDCDPVAPNQG